MAKLEALKADLLGQGHVVDPPLLVGNSDDQQSVDAIVGAGRVLLSTAGPFLQYGRPVVDACVRLGTDYVDITGETPFVRATMDEYGQAARERGVFVIPMCGYDSIPSDLGTQQTVEAIHERFGEPTRRVDNFVLMKGALSGGTLESGIQMEKDPELYRMLKDPFLLGGARAVGVREEDRDIVTAELNPLVGHWTAPFMMAELNTRVVRRSCELFETEGFVMGAEGEAQPLDGGLLYSKEFGYNERMVLGDNEKAARKLARGSPPAEKRVEMREAGRLPKQGEGPSAEIRAKSFFKMMFVGESESGQRLVTSVSGGDPGYTETAKFVSESALSLALQRDQLPASLLGLRGGVLTPAFAMGHVLKARLHNAGIEFKHERLPQPGSKL